MVIEKNIDVFKSGAKVFAHQVNCQGVMGAGIAKTVKTLYPRAFSLYKNLCESNRGATKNLLGSCQIVDTGTGVYVANLFGQDEMGRCKRQTDYPSLRKSLQYLRDFLEDREIDTVAMPHGIGCGLAGGDWNIVFEIIKEIFDETDIKCFVCKI